MFIRSSLRLGAAMLPLGVAVAPLALAQIATDGTVGPRATLSGPNLTIGAELGSIRGNNLFHSFQTFNIQTGESATFTGPGQIANVIGRVTGGRTSTIDGTLRSTVGQADVYLINPAGVVMGPNATVEVPAALHVSTADELRFQDGSRYSARDPAASTLTVAAPEAFGFLTPQPAALTLTGSQLAVKTGKTLSLTAGEVTIAGTAERRASLKAPAGTLRVEAVGAAGGAVPAAAPSATPGAGTLTIDQADLDTSGDGGGRIALRAGTATVSDATLVAENQGAADATGGIDLDITASLALDSSYVFADTAASGRGGTARIRAGALQMSNDSYITSDSYRPEGDPGLAPIGDGGGVTVEVAGLLELSSGSHLLTQTLAEGQAGGIRVRAANAYLTHAEIKSYSYPESTGNAGAVTMEIAGQLDVDLSGIGSNTWGAGNAGPVTLTIGAYLLTRNGSEIASSTHGAGHGNSVTIEVDGLLEMKDGAIASSALPDATGDSGTVTIRARELRMGGVPGAFPVIVSQSNPQATGDSGAVTVEVDGLLELLGGAEISSGTWGGGNAGTVNVRAGSARLVGLGHLPRTVTESTWIMSGAYWNLSSGHAGDVTVEIGETLEIRDGAAIQSSTWGPGDAGSVTVAARTIRLDGGATGVSTQIASRAESVSSGAAGDVSIRAESLELRRGGTVSIASLHDRATATPDQAHAIRIASERLSLDAGTIGADSRGPTPAAAIAIQSDAIRLANDSRITTAARQADAGPIAIAGGLLSLDDSLITTSAETIGNGGDIRLVLRQLVLDGGFIQANTGAPGARGGSILIDTPALIASQGLLEVGGTQRQVFSPGSGRNVIQAAAEGGEQGTIQVTAPTFDLNALLAPLTAATADPEELLRDACQVARGQEPSRLVERLGGGAAPLGADAAAGVPFTGARLERMLAE